MNRYVKPNLTIFKLHLPKLQVAHLFTPPPPTSPSCSFAPHQAPWGLFWKVGLGASLGILDFGTDVYSIGNFVQRRQYGFANAMVATISISMLVQLLLVYGQGRRREAKHLAKEMLTVITGFKPALDAYRVIRGAKPHVDDTFDPEIELLGSKVAELVAEAIPSSLVQLYAMLLTGSSSVSSLVSVIVSVATISFSTVTMCFDFDLHPDRRMYSSDFYGYVPSSSGLRAVVFYSMFIFTACNVSVRLLGIAILAVISPVITGAIVGGDVVFFLAIKAARGDLRYWLNIDGILSWIVSFVIRIFAKLMVDFTAMVQLRRKFISFLKFQSLLFTYKAPFPPFSFLSRPE